MLKKMGVTAIHRMMSAFLADQKAIDEGKPATAKVQLLPRLERVFGQWVAPPTSASFSPLEPVQPPLVSFSGSFAVTHARWPPPAPPRPAARRKEVMGQIDQPKFLSACTMWLTPLRANQLPGLEVRTFVLRVLAQIDLEDDRVADLLKGSKVVSAVKYLSQHPKETPDNKKIANQLIRAWGALSL